MPFPKTARIFANGRSQAVRLPAEFRFPGDRVRVSRQGKGVLLEGKQLAVMIMSSDREFTLWPKAGAQLTIDLSKSSVSIPIVGGVEALQKAGMR